MNYETKQYETSILKKVELGMTKTMEEMKPFVEMKKEDMTPEDVLNKLELQERLNALKLIKSELIRENGAVKGTNTEYLLNEDEETKLLLRLKNAHEESMKGYQKSGRTDLYDHEKAELDVINEYTPKQPTEEEITEYTKGLIAEYLATKEEGYQPSMRDMGQIMPKVKAKYPLVDGNIVRKALLG